MRTQRILLGIGVLVLAFSTAIGIGSAAVLADVQHGISFTKGCSSPTQIGQPYSCAYSMRNVVDEAQDTLTFDGVTDVVHASGGNVSSGNLFNQLRYEIGTFLPGFSTPPFCTGGVGTGTNPDPFRSAPGNPLISCTLPFGSRLNVQSFSFYTVVSGDFGLPAHQLTDSAELTWHDLCNDPAHTGNTNCAPNPPNSGAGSASTIAQITSTTSTAIHNAAHATVTSVGIGTTVHDFVTVDGGAGNPPPTGTVSIDFFQNGTCAGAPTANSGSVGPLAPSGPNSSSFDATAFAITVNFGGMRAFKAHYLGDPGNPVYTASDGPCEPLNVVDANIQITPDGVNRVGQIHTFIGHVNVNDGTGSVPAPNGTVINFSFNGGPPSASCTTAGGTGSCSITYSSALTGVDTVNASTTLSVGGVSLTRTTNGVAPNSGPATKRWVNAKIQISPDATNPINGPHTFTVTLQKDDGSGAGFVAAAGEHVDFTLTNSNGAGFVLNTASSTCDDAGANTNATGQCTIVFTSPTAGKVTGHASSTLSVAGSAPFTVQTNGVGGSSVDAVKTFVDANIQITPNGTNRVGATHTFTGHVNINRGDGAGFVPAPAGTLITFTKVSGPGTLSGTNPCATVGATGSCTIDLTSPTTGVTTVSASTFFPVSGLPVVRTTDGVGANSGPAVKTWVNAKISIAPNATNEVNAPHTFTVTLEKDTGTGVFVPANGEHVAVLLNALLGAGIDVNFAASTCTGPGPNTDANGRCTMVFTSATPGTVTGHAVATLSVGGSAPFTVQTDGIAPNSGDAVKTFVNANIQITPATATNPVGTNHVLTITVNAIGGTIDAGPHTATASIVSGPGTFVGSSSCTYNGGAATASCTVTITSATAGTTVVSATSSIPVNGHAITRTTNGTAGNSGPANKVWVAPHAAVRTDVHNAAHIPITTAAAGDVVHDKAFVTKAAGTPAATPAPTGSVIFHRYTNLNCTGASVDETVPLALDGTAESSTFTFTADMSYRADYPGDAVYPAASGACEPLALQATGCPSCPPPPCPAFPVFPGNPGGGPCSLNVLAVSIKGNLLEITIQNTGSADAVLNGLGLTFPTSNGGLKSVALDGYLYTGPVVTGGSFTMTAAQLAGVNPLLRTIKMGQSEKLRFFFEKTASTNTAAYTSVAEFNTGCIINLFA